MIERLPLTIRLTAEQKRALERIQKYHGLTGIQDAMSFLIAKEDRQVSNGVKVGKA